MLNETKPADGWAIEALGLEKAFGEKPVLRGVDVQVGRGECLVIFGPNGAGKTTLLKVLATLLKPSAGSVRIDGMDIRDNPPQIRRNIGLVGHQTFLYDNLTLYENLKFYGKMYGLSDLDRRIRDVASWARLEPQLEERAGTLSRGLQQRASVARAMLHNPSILFLDEPEVGLDPHAAAIIKDVMGNINSDSRTVIMTTHNLDRGLELADTVMILDSGRVVYRESRRAIAPADFLQIYDRCITTGR